MRYLCPWGSNTSNNVVAQLVDEIDMATSIIRSRHKPRCCCYALPWGAVSLGLQDLLGRRALSEVLGQGGDGRLVLALYCAHDQVVPVVLLHGVYLVCAGAGKVPAGRALVASKRITADAGEVFPTCYLVIST